MIAIPGGTVTEANTGTGDTMNWGAGAKVAYAKPCEILAFKIGQTEVTYELWEAVRVWAELCGYTFANPGRQGGDSTVGGPAVGTNQHPVTLVSWRDAVVWCNAYSEATGRTPAYRDSSNTILRDSSQTVESLVDESKMTGTDGFRLPTEAQWEFAARGGIPSTSAPWTNTYAGTNEATDLGDYAWYDANSGSATHAVKGKGANIAGLYDMSGNVYEWCQDIYGPDTRVIRGGGWFYPASQCAVAYRDRFDPSTGSSGFGFRIACP
jgi:formylglycine-generating enzyme required for sulfatase activity